MEEALEEVPYSFYDFETDVRLPATEQLEIYFARYGWMDGPPTPLYLERRMVPLVRELARAQSLYPDNMGSLTHFLL